MNSEQFWQWRDSGFTRPLIMGVLNVTPDSFSDGGAFLNRPEALRRALDMLEEGADIIDVGGQSTKPGVDFANPDIELDRVIPVIEAIRRQTDCCISIDTNKAIVMRDAIRAGATMVNDIQALTGEGTLSVVAKAKVAVCLMHMQGTPKTMQDNPYYKGDVVEIINDFFKARLLACLQAGIEARQLILDPGFGFGKTHQQNLQLLKQISKFKTHGLPLLLGISRKSTVGAIVHADIHERLPGTLAGTVYAIMNGASIIRTHDVKETNQAIQMLQAICMENEKNR